jgi:hypothetical protein
MLRRSIVAAFVETISGLRINLDKSRAAIDATIDSAVIILMR